MTDWMADGMGTHEGESVGVMVRPAPTRTSPRAGMTPCAAASDTAFDGAASIAAARPTVP